jgi:serralysin
MSGNVYINALAGTASMLTAGRDNVVTYHFDNGASRAWTAEEKAGMRAALDAWAAVANVSFVEVATRAEADISEALYSRSLMTLLVGPGVTALHAYPDGDADVFGGIYSITGQPGDAHFNLNLYGVTAGSRNLQIFMHEIGHALGLDHPHDSEFGSGVLPGVTSPTSLGDFDLNQNIFTLMSYNTFGTPTATSGNAAGPMAFDIAAIQKLYGANMDYQSGNSVYTLSSAPTANFWKCLWDTGGVDWISYVGTAATVIDLRAANLLQGPHAGGWLSFADGAYGGFTIAKGVVIENASGGGGNDQLTGNAANNTILGKSGNDRIVGCGGQDKLFGGTGIDRLVGGQGADILSGGQGADRLTGGVSSLTPDSAADIFHYGMLSHSTVDREGRDTIVDFESGVDIINLASLDADAALAGNQAFTFIADRAFSRTSGELRFVTRQNGTLVLADVDGDAQADFAVFLLNMSNILSADFVL